MAATSMVDEWSLQTFFQGERGVKHFRNSQHLSKGSRLRIEKGSPSPSARAQGLPTEGSLLQISDFQQGLRKIPTGLPLYLEN